MTDKPDVDAVLKRFCMMKSANCQTELETDLAAALRQLQERIKELEGEWERECDDADKILAALGLAEDQGRTEGGSLHVPRIVNRIKMLERIAEPAKRLLALYDLRFELARKEKAGIDVRNELRVYGEQKKADWQSLREAIDTARKEGKG